MRSNWVKASKGNSEFYVNLATATKIRRISGGSNICWPSNADQLDILSVNETPEELLAQLPAD